MRNISILKNTLQNMITNGKHLKLDNMPDLELRQLQYESDTWKRLLGFIEEENIHLKNRLSEILRSGFNDNLLDELENFHGRFVREDELIRLLRNNVAELDDLLERELFEDGKIIKEIRRKLKNLSDNIQNIQERFTKLKLEFNSFMSENI
jgi:hypothetical protein